MWHCVMSTDSSSPRLYCILQHGHRVPVLWKMQGKVCGLELQHQDTTQCHIAGKIPCNTDIQICMWQVCHNGDEGERAGQRGIPAVQNADGAPQHQLENAAFTVRWELPHLQEGFSEWPGDQQSHFSEATPNDPRPTIQVAPHRLPAGCPSTPWLCQGLHHHNLWEDSEDGFHQKGQSLRWNVSSFCTVHSSSNRLTSISRFTDKLFSYPFWMLS